MSFLRNVAYENKNLFLFCSTTSTWQQDDRVPNIVNLNPIAASILTFMPKSAERHFSKDSRVLYFWVRIWEFGNEEAGINLFQEKGI